MHETHVFNARLELDDHTTGTYVTIPFDVPAAFGTRGRVPVAGAINGIPFRGSIVSMGQGAYVLGITRVLRSQAKAQAGDEVEIVLGRDEEPRTVNPPADLVAAWAQNGAAKAAWDALSYSHRREIVEAIEAAKKPETRARRVEQAIARLAGQQK